MKKNSFGSLLLDNRIYPLLIVQFGAAFNDNFLKSALIMLFTYGQLDREGFTVDEINNLAAMIMILPFLLFAPTMGQFADKYNKAAVARWAKLGEVFIMLLAGVALWMHSTVGLLCVLFMIGTQSACFSPVKYSIVPQLVEPDELTHANSLMHMGTSLSIFLGLIAGTFIVQVPQGQWVFFICGVAVALIGWGMSLKIKDLPPAAPDLPIKWNMFSQVSRSLRFTWEKRNVFWAVIGISWYWFVGSVYLTQLPNFSLSVLAADESVVRFMLLLFLIGVCAGAITCQKLSARWGQFSTVVLGGVLIALAGLGLGYAGNAMLLDMSLPRDSDQLRSIAEVFSQIPGMLVAFYILLVGVAGGLYVVPLFVMMQSFSALSHRGQVAATNNCLNAGFMVSAGFFGVLCLGRMELSIPDFFYSVSVLHCIVLVVLVLKAPVFWQSFTQVFRRCI